MILHPMASLAFFLQAGPGVDWLYQFTNNLTNLTTANGDALSSVGMSLLAFISLIKLVRMVAHWNISTMTISWSTRISTFHTRLSMIGILKFRPGSAMR